MSLTPFFMMIPLAALILGLTTGIFGGHYKKAVYETETAAVMQPIRIVIDQSVTPFDRSPSGTRPAAPTESSTEPLTETENGAAVNPEETTDAPPPETSAEETTEALAESEPGLPTVSVGDVLSDELVERIGEDNLFWQSKITENTYARINGKSYGSGCPVPVSSLRYLRVLHYDFDGNIRVGELICNQSISSDLLSIFHQLYSAKYPIEKIVLVDEYNADDDASSSDNNTSCFNYRTVAGSSSLSLHALGVAIDINPLYNPYVTNGGAGCAPENGRVYMDRSRNFDYKIDENDLCYRLFTEAGFTWGGSWESNPDYMHFSRGSKPET